MGGMYCIRVYTLRADTRYLCQTCVYSYGKKKTKMDPCVCNEPREVCMTSMQGENDIRDDTKKNNIVV